MNRPLGWLCLLVAAVLSGSPVRCQGEDVLALALEMARRRDEVLDHYEVVATAKVSVRRQQAVEPPAAVDVRILYADRRALVIEAGVDDLRIRDSEGRSIERQRLFHPSGFRETFYPKSGQFTYTEVSTGDPRYAYDVFMPNEYVLSFCSSPRHQILATREFEVISTSGEIGHRLVSVRGLSRDGSQRMEFDLREDWDWLPALARATAQVAGEWTPYYVIEVTDVRRTRLGVMPARARHVFHSVDTNDGQGKLLCVTDAEIEFGEFVFDGAETPPRTLNPEFRGGEPAVPGDTLYAETSFMSSARLSGRDAEIGRMVGSLGTGIIGGVRSWRWLVWSLGLYGVSLVSLLGLLIRSRRRVLWLN